MNAEGGIQREVFSTGGFTEKLQNAIFEINKRNELGILSRAEDISKASGIDKSDINKYIRTGRLPKLITKEEAVKKYIDNALLNNKSLSEFKNKAIYDYLNNSLPEGSKGRVGQKEIERFLKKNYSNLWNSLYAKKTGAMDFINRNEKIKNLGVNDYLKNPELVKNQTYIENLSLGAKRDELRILNAKLKLGVKDFAISQAQDRLVDDLNKAIRKNPSIVLNNPKLMELASTRVDSKTGSLIIGARDQNKIKADIDKGFFSKEHLNPKGGEKMNVEFPTNKILVPRTTNESFIRSLQSYIKNNPKTDLNKEILDFIDYHGFNVRTEAGQTLGPKIGSTIENGKLGSFARQLQSYGVDTSNFNLNVENITKEQLDELRGPIKSRQEELSKVVNVNKNLEIPTDDIIRDAARSSTLLSEGVPGARYVTPFVNLTSEGIMDIAKGVRTVGQKGAFKSAGKGLLKLLPGAGLGYGIYDTGVGFKEGVSVPELGTRFFGLDPVYRYAQEQMNLSPEARKIQRAINRNIAAEAEDVAGLGMFDLQPAKEVTEEEKQILEKELEKIRQNRETLNQQRAQERADLLNLIEGKINPNAVAYRSEFSAGGIAALKALLNFLGKARGKKGSELLQEVNPKKYGTVIENLMLPDDKKMIGGFRVEYLESLLDTIKNDKAMLDRMKKMPADQQESFFNMINQGANRGRLDVYKKINPDEAILEIEQMIKNLKTKDMSPEEIKRSLNAYGGRIGFDEGGPGDPSRRKFFKIMGGLASLPILGKIAKPIAKIGPEATEVVSRTAEQMPVYLTTLINKIKSIGKSKLIGKPDNPDGFVQYDLEDYTLIEGPGYTRVSKTEYGASSQGEGIKNQLEVEIKKDPETGAIEYDEFTVSPDAEGKLKDVDFGIEDVDHKTMETFANE